jgi:hypothetical protein
MTIFQNKHINICIRTFTENRLVNLPKPYTDKVENLIPI